MTEALESLDLECIDDWGDQGSRFSEDDYCSGKVEYRVSLSGTGISHPRCDKHWGIRLDLEDEINQRYPVHAPSDFDPYYAGEHWDEDY